MKETKYIDLTNTNDYTSLKEASLVLKQGGLVIFPTETVYGIGANGLDERAVLKIYEAKGRKSDNPLILHISNLDMLKDIVTEISPIEKELMTKFWPGPLTIILPKKDNVPNIVSAGLKTVGVRFPKNPIANTLIELTGVPIAAPSANISGRPSGTNISDIKDEFENKVDYIIDGGDSQVGLESTVVIVKDETIHILRPGKITKEDLLSITKNVEVDNHILSKTDNEPVLSPGMKYRHYAPKTPCVLVYSKDETKLINAIKEETRKTNNYLILTNSKHAKVLDNAIIYGDTLEEISHNIFKLLREVDKKNVDLIIIEGVETKDLGLAIMNRLLRACSYNSIEV